MNKDGVTLVKRIHVKYSYSTHNSSSRFPVKALLFDFLSPLNRLTVFHSIIMTTIHLHSLNARSDVAIKTAAAIAATANATEVSLTRLAVAKFIVLIHFTKLPASLIKLGQVH